jgi:hypothetical protein
MNPVFMLHGNYRLAFLSLFCAFMLLGVWIYDVFYKKERKSIISQFVLNIIIIGSAITALYIFSLRLNIREGTLEYSNFFSTTKVILSETKGFYREHSERRNYDYILIMKNGREVKLYTAWLYNELTLKDYLIYEEALEFKGER